MEATTGLIKSKVVTAEYDQFWMPVDDFVAGMVPKPILILVSNYADGSNDEVQLKKMLIASNLTPLQYNLLRLNADTPVAWYRLKQVLRPKIVFIIGINPARLGISALLKLNEPNRFGDCIWLPTVSMAELDIHADVKKQLWFSGMVPVFVDKLWGSF